MIQVKMSLNKMNLTRNNRRGYSTKLSYYLLVFSNKIKTI